MFFRANPSHMLGSQPKAPRVIACFVLLVSLAGTLRSDYRARENDRPVAFEQLSIGITSPGWGFFSKAAFMSGLRGRRRRIRMRVPRGTANPRDQVAFHLARSKSPSSLYEGIPRQKRRHLLPPATGPPGARLQRTPSLPSGGVIHRGLPKEPGTPRGIRPPRSPRKPP